MSIKDNLLETFHSKRKKIITVAVSAAVLTVIVTLVAVLSPGYAASGGDASAEDGKKFIIGEAAGGIMEGIPLFPADPDDSEEFEDSLALYYYGVSGESIAEYAEKLYAETGADLRSGIYPRSAVYDGRIITLHYNVTERNFSVTVTRIAN